MAVNSSSQPAAAQPSADKIFNPDYFKLWFALFFFMLNMSTFNLLPYYLELRGASPDLYGSVAGSMGISNFLSLALLGRWADLWSRKTTVLVYIVPAVAGNLIAIWAMEWSSLNWYYLSRLLHGIFMGLGFPIVFGWTVEVTPPRAKHLVLAWLGIGGILANSLGPSLAELLLSLQPRMGDPEAYFPVFIMATAFQLVSIVFFVSTRSTRAEVGESGSSSGLSHLMKRKESVLVLLVAFSFGGMFGVVMSFGKNFTALLDLNYVSVLLWAYSIGAILSRVFIQQIVRYVAHRHLIPLGLLGIGISFLMLGQTQGYYMLGGAGGLYGLSHGILFPTLFVRFIDIQQRGEIGRSSTLFQGLFSIGWGMFPFFGGTFIGMTSFPSLFGVLAALAGIGIILHLHAEQAAWQRRRGSIP